MDANTLLASPASAVSVPPAPEPAASAPLLLSPTRNSEGLFQFQIEGLGGAEFEVLTSANLKTWSSLGRATAARGATTTYVDAQSGAPLLRFYRIVGPGNKISRNTLGFARVRFPQGFSLLANPFKTVDDKVSSMFPSMPEGTALCKFDLTTHRLGKNNFRQGCWSDPAQTLITGEGAIFHNPGFDVDVLEFAGEVQQGDFVSSVASGFSIRSSLIPIAGRLDGDLGFPFAPGDVIHTFDGQLQKYVTHRFGATAWEDQPPTVGVGEAFWVGKGKPALWFQHTPT